MSPQVASLEGRCLLSTATITALELSAPSLTYGRAEVFTATVTTSPPSDTTPTGGTVSFMDGLTTLDSQELSAGSATFSTTGLGVGPHVVTAVYSGDAAFDASQSGSSSARPSQPSPVAAAPTAGRRPGSLSTLPRAWPSIRKATCSSPTR